MRWFKHPADMAAYPLVAKIRSEFGSLGYAAVCLMLEKVTASWEYKKESPTMPELLLPMRDWKELTGFSLKKFQKFMEICQDDTFICIEIEGKLLRVKIPILLKWRDDYTQKQMRKSGQTQEEVHTNSAVQQQEEPEELKRQNNTMKSWPAKMEQDLRRILLKNGISPDSKRGEFCIVQALSKARDTPVGYLIGTLKNDPDFGKDAEWNSGERQYGTKSVGEILAKLDLPFPIKQKE